MIDSKNVLHIVDSMGLGGAQTIIRSIFESVDNDQRYFLFSLRKRDVSVSVSHSNFVTFNSEKKYSIRSISALKRTIIERNIAILHCHLFKSQIFGCLLKLFWRNDLKLVFHEHGEIFQRHFFYDLFMSLSERYVDHYIAVSRATAVKLHDVVGMSHSKIDVMYNCLSVSVVEASQSRTRFHDEVMMGMNVSLADKYVLGFVGRLSIEKGAHYLVRAMASIDSGCVLLIAGVGRMELELRELAHALGVGERVFFLGYVSNVEEFYSVIDVLVAPSISESFGLAAIEAQANGVPVIASRVGGLAEILNDSNCVFFAVGDVEGLAKTIADMRAGVLDADALIHNGRVNAERFSVGTYVRGLESLYAKL